MKKWLYLVLFLLVLLAGAVTQHKFLLSSYASFFTVNNPSKGADAIVILSGEQKTRIPFGLKLHSEGYAPLILLTDEKKMNVEFAYLFPSNQNVAQAVKDKLQLDVQLETVPSLIGGATSTFDEAYDLRKFSEERGLKHLILLTDAYHTRRALHAFETAFKGSQIRLEMAAAPNDVFNENNWWTSDRGISAYVLESIKYPVYLLSSRNNSYIRND